MQVTMTKIFFGYARKTVGCPKPRLGMGHVYMTLTLLAVAALPLSAETIGLCNTGFGPNCGALLNNLLSSQIDGTYRFTGPFSACRLSANVNTLKEITI